MSFPFISHIVAALLLLPALSLAGSAIDHTNPAMADGDMQTDFKARISGMARSNKLEWLCYYGDDRTVLALPQYNLLVLEADALGPLATADKDGRICMAYMSIGEISRSRWFWPLVEDKPWVLEKDADWTGAVRVDPRSQEWRDLLVNTIAPRLLGAGYDGLMLDNVDIGEYLEQKDPAKYAGAKNAVVDIIRRLRETYPNAAIITNGGLDTAAETANCLDAVIRESIFSRWVMNANGSVSYEDVSPEARAWLRPRLLRIRGTGLPILDLEYVDPGDVRAIRQVFNEAKKAGYSPYIAQRSLMHLPARQKTHSAK